MHFGKSNVCSFGSRLSVGFVTLLNPAETNTIKHHRCLNTIDDWLNLWIRFGSKWWWSWKESHPHFAQLTLFAVGTWLKQNAGFTRTRRGSEKAGLRLNTKWYKMPWANPPSARKPAATYLTSTWKDSAIVMSAAMSAVCLWNLLNLHQATVASKVVADVEVGLLTWQLQWLKVTVGRETELQPSWAERRLDKISTPWSWN